MIMLPLVRLFSYCLLAIVLLVPHARPVHACPQLTSAPHSQWKVETQQGVSWLMTPCGERFFSIGVNVLNGGYPSRIFAGRLAYHWGTFHPSLEQWVTATLQRLAAWGFNTAGGWSLEPAQLALPFMANLELGRQSRFVWFDPFRPTMEEEMRAWAHRLVAPYKGNPYRIGYFSDNEIGWWYSAMFTYYLQLPATNYTKQKLVALVAYLGAADNISRPLPSRLSDGNQPITCSRHALSRPHPTRLACLCATVYPRSISIATSHRPVA